MTVTVLPEEIAALAKSRMAMPPAPATECVLWTGRLSKDGYPYRARHTNVCRELWAQAYGEIGPGMEIDHLCFNRACVNLQHLRIVDKSTNAKRQRKALRDHCIRGHRYEGDNIRWMKNGARGCRACERVHHKILSNRRAVAKKLAAIWDNADALRARLAELEGKL